MKKCMKMLAWMLCFVMVLGMFPMVQAEEAPFYANEDDVVIYYTNDIHTYINKDLSYDNLAYLKAETAKQAAGVLLVDAGDAIQGTAYGSMDKGKTIIDLMNAADYDVATLGNHEFDYGMEGCMNAIEWAEFPYVSANFYHEKDGVAGDAVLDAYKVFEVGGMKIAFVGLTTPESFTKSTPAYFQDENGSYIYGIAGGTDGAALYAAAQKAIDDASAEADIIIALGHLGDDPASQPWTSEELIANTTGLDAFIDGHSHSTVPSKIVKDKNGDDVILTQTGEYFDAIGKLTISADGTIETGLYELVIVEDDNDVEIDRYVSYTSTGEPVRQSWMFGSDAAVKAIKDAWMAEIDTKLGEVIGYLDVSLENYDESGRLVRKQETNTGDFCADALYYLFQNLGLDVDVAIMNGGGIRNKSAITGEFTYKSAKEIHTFGNVACLQTITGQQLLDALEWGAKDAPDAEHGGFLHVSGITYTVDTTIPSTVQADDKGVWTGGPTGEYRVKNVRIFQDGEWVDLDLNAKYNLAGYNYTLRDLGDGFAMFDGAVNVLDFVMEDYMVLANYIKSFPVDETTGLPTVTAGNSVYDNVYGAGRIRVVKDFEDVPADSYYYDAVKWAVIEGITNGATETTFHPTGDLLRAQVVTMLWRAAGEPVVEFENPFTDVHETDFYYNAVLWAVSQDITNGTSATEFSPLGITNRAQAVTFLWRAMGEPAASAEVSFTDVADGQFYTDAVAWAVENNVTNGISATAFGITENCNRAHMVTFLYRASLIETEEPEEPETPSKPTYVVDFKDDGNGTVLCDVSRAAPGEEIHFFAIPNEGYEFAEFVLFDPTETFDTSKIQLRQGEQENEWIVVMIDYPLIVTCKFAPISG